MARTPSTMLPLGTAAPDFRLLNVDGQMVGLDDFRGAPAYFIAFICNHCPFVKHVADGLAELGREYQSKGVAVIAISSNDASKYPADSPEQMVHEAENRNYTFPYLYDETQDIAKAYRAACTPDFYVFDRDRKLAYRGQMDDSRPDSGIPVTGRYLRAALNAVLAGKPVPEAQRPSIGCNIKWKVAGEPDYFGHVKV
jgi:peroxiredoxin